jgi:hypothetical protein
MSGIAAINTVQGQQEERRRGGDPTVGVEAFVANFLEKILIKLTDLEKAEIRDVARRGAQRCRDAIVKLQLTDLEDRKQIRQQLEETLMIWNNLAASTEPEADPVGGTESYEKLCEVESPKLSEHVSPIEMVIAQK